MGGVNSRSKSDLEADKDFLRAATSDLFSDASLNSLYNKVESDYKPSLETEWPENKARLDKTLTALQTSHGLVDVPGEETLAVDILSHYVAYHSDFAYSNKHRKRAVVLHRIRDAVLRSLPEDSLVVASSSSPSSSAADAAATAAAGSDEAGPSTTSDGEAVADAVIDETPSSRRRARRAGKAVASAAPAAAAPKAKPSSATATAIRSAVRIVMAMIKANNDAATLGAILAILVETVKDLPVICDSPADAEVDDVLATLFAELSALQGEGGAAGAAAGLFTQVLTEIAVVRGSLGSILTVVQSLLNSDSVAPIDFSHAASLISARSPVFGSNTLAEIVREIAVPSPADANEGAGISGVAADEKNVYLHVNGKGLFAIGSGFQGTTAGKVVATYETAEHEAGVSMAVVGSVLYFRSDATGASVISFALPGLEPLGETGHEVDEGSQLVSDGVENLYAVGLGGSPTKTLTVNAYGLNADATLSHYDTFDLRGSPKTVAANVVVAVNCGGGAYVGDDGVKYSADGWFGGAVSRAATKTDVSVSGSPDKWVYRNQRISSGEFEYNFEVPVGEYYVTLRFAELSATSAGSVVFNATVNGVPVARELDLYGTVGSNTAYDIRAHAVADRGVVRVQLGTSKSSGEAHIAAIVVEKAVAETAATDFEDLPLGLTPACFANEHFLTVIADDTDAASERGLAYVFDLRASRCLVGRYSVSSSPAALQVAYDPQHNVTWATSGANVVCYTNGAYRPPRSVPWDGIGLDFLPAGSALSALPPKTLAVALLGELGRLSQGQGPEAPVIDLGAAASRFETAYPFCSEASETTFAALTGLIQAHMPAYHGTWDAAAENGIGAAEALHVLAIAIKLLNVNVFKLPAGQKDLFAAYAPSLLAGFQTIIEDETDRDGAAADIQVEVCALISGNLDAFYPPSDQAALLADMVRQKAAGALSKTKERLTLSLLEKFAHTASLALLFSADSPGTRELLATMIEVVVAETTEFRETFYSRPMEELEDDVQPSQSSAMAFVRAAVNFVVVAASAALSKSKSAKDLELAEQAGADDEETAAAIRRRASPAANVSDMVDTPLATQVEESRRGLLVFACNLILGCCSDAVDELDAINARLLPDGGAAHPSILAFVQASMVGQLLPSLFLGLSPFSADVAFVQQILPGLTRFVAAVTKLSNYVPDLPDVTSGLDADTATGILVVDPSNLGVGQATEVAFAMTTGIRCVVRRNATGRAAATADAADAFESDLVVAVAFFGADGEEVASTTLTATELTGADGAVPEPVNHDGAVRATVEVTAAGPASFDLMFCPVALAPTSSAAIESFTELAVGAHWLAAKAAAALIGGGADPATPAAAAAESEAKEVTSWVRSNLFSGGFEDPERAAGDVTDVEAFLDTDDLLAGNDGGDDDDDARMPALLQRSDTLINETALFLFDVLGNEDHALIAALSAVSPIKFHRVPDSPATRRLLRGVFVAVLKHEDLATAALAYTEALPASSDAAPPAPPARLLTSWETCFAIFKWLLKEKQRRAKAEDAISYDDLADTVLRKVEFLLSFSPSNLIPDAVIQRRSLRHQLAMRAEVATGVGGFFGGGGGDGSAAGLGGLGALGALAKKVKATSAGSAAMEALSQLTDILRLRAESSNANNPDSDSALAKSVLDFLEAADVSAEAIEAAIQARATKAANRLNGLRLVRHLLLLSRSGSTSVGEVGALQTLRWVRRAFAQAPSWHYLTGLEGCGARLANDLTTAYFEMVSSAVVPLMTVPPAPVTPALGDLRVCAAGAAVIPYRAVDFAPLLKSGLIEALAAIANDKVERGEEMSYAPADESVAVSSYREVDCLTTMIDEFDFGNEGIISSTTPVVRSAFEMIAAAATAAKVDSDTADEAADFRTAVFGTIFEKACPAANLAQTKTVCLTGDPISSCLVDVTPDEAGSWSVCLYVYLPETFKHDEGVLLHSVDPGSSNDVFRLLVNPEGKLRLVVTDMEVSVDADEDGAEVDEASNEAAKTAALTLKTKTWHSVRLTRTPGPAPAIELWVGDLKIGSGLMASSVISDSLELRPIFIGRDFGSSDWTPANETLSVFRGYVKVKHPLPDHVDALPDGFLPPVRSTAATLEARHLLGLALRACRSDAGIAAVKPYLGQILGLAVFTGSSVINPDYVLAVQALRILTAVIPHPDAGLTMADLDALVGGGGSSATFMELALELIGDARQARSDAGNWNFTRPNFQIAAIAAGELTSLVRSMMMSDNASLASATREAVAVPLAAAAAGTLPLSSPSVMGVLKVLGAFSDVIRVGASVVQGASISPRPMTLLTYDFSKAQVSGKSGDVKLEDIRPSETGAVPLSFSALIEGGDGDEAGDASWVVAVLGHLHALDKLVDAAAEDVATFGTAPFLVRASIMRILAAAAMSKPVIRYVVSSGLLADMAELASGTLDLPDFGTVADFEKARLDLMSELYNRGYGTAAGASNEEGESSGEEGEAAGDGAPAGFTAKAELVAKFAAAAEAAEAAETADAAADEGTSGGDADADADAATESATEAGAEADTGGDNADGDNNADNDGGDDDGNNNDDDDDSASVASDESFGFGLMDMFESAGDSAASTAKTSSEPVAPAEDPNNPLVSLRLYDRKEPSPVPTSVVQATKAWPVAATCSFAVHKRTPHDQRQYTVSRSAVVKCCAACAMTCHEGHDVTVSSELSTEFVCECGSGSHTSDGVAPCRLLTTDYAEVKVTGLADGAALAIGVIPKGKGAGGYLPPFFGYASDGRIAVISGVDQVVTDRDAPAVGVGDTIGVGIDYNAEYIFFTHNGVNLGPAFRSPDKGVSVNLMAWGGEFGNGVAVEVVDGAVAPAGPAPSTWSTAFVKDGVRLSGLYTDNKDVRSYAEIDLTGRAGNSITAAVRFYTSDGVVAAEATGVVSFGALDLTWIDTDNSTTIHHLTLDRISLADYGEGAEVTVLEGVREKAMSSTSARSQTGRMQVAVRECSFALNGGAGKYLHVGNPADMNFGDTATLEAWVKLPDLAAGGEPAYIIAHGNGGNNGKDRYAFLRVNDGHFEAGTVEGSASSIARAPIDAQAHVGPWVHLAAVAEGSKWTLFVGGDKADTSSATDSTFSVWTSINRNWCVGGMTLHGVGDHEANEADQTFPGVIDEVRIWSLAREPEHIKKFASIVLESDSEGLAAWYPLQAGFGPTAFDRTSNSNDGLIKTAAGNEGGAEASPWVFSSNRKKRGAVSIAFDPESALEGSLEFSDKNKTVKVTSCVSWQAVRTNVKFATGKHSFEVSVVKTIASSGIMFGVCVEEQNKSSYAGSSAHGWSFHGSSYSSYTYHQGSSNSYGKAIKEGDVVEVTVDMDNGALSFAINGESQGDAFSGCDWAGKILYPCVSMYDNNDTVTIGKFKSTTLTGDDTATSTGVGLRGRLSQIGISDEAMEAAGIDDLDDASEIGSLVAGLYRAGEVVSAKRKGKEAADPNLDDDGTAEIFVPSGGKNLAFEMNGDEEKPSNSSNSNDKKKRTPYTAANFASTGPNFDFRIHNKMVHTCEALSILYARRGIDAMLANWPSDVPFEPAVLGGDDAGVAERLLVMSGARELVPDGRDKTPREDSKVLETFSKLLASGAEEAGGLNPVWRERLFSLFLTELVKLLKRDDNDDGKLFNDVDAVGRPNEMLVMWLADTLMSASLGPVELNILFNTLFVFVETGCLKEQESFVSNLRLLGKGVQVVTALPSAQRPDLSRLSKLRNLMVDQVEPILRKAAASTGSNSNAADAVPSTLVQVLVELNMTIARAFSKASTPTAGGDMDASAWKAATAAAKAEADGDAAADKKDGEDDDAGSDTSEEKAKKKKEEEEKEKDKKWSLEKIMAWFEKYGRAVDLLHAYATNAPLPEDLVTEAMLKTMSKACFGVAVESAHPYAPSLKVGEVTFENATEITFVFEDPTELRDGDMVVVSTDREGKTVTASQAAPGANKGVLVVPGPTAFYHFPASISVLFDPDNRHEGMKVGDAGLSIEVDSAVTRSDWRTAKCLAAIPRTGTTRFGITIEKVTYGNMFIGLCEHDYPNNNFVGCNSGSNSWAYYGCTSRYERGSCYTYGQSFQTGDLIEVEINRDEGTINYYHNGEDQGEAHTGVPNDIDLYPAASALEIGDKLIFEGGGITPPQGTGPTTYGIKAVAYPSAFNAEGLAAAKTRLESEFAAFSRFHSGFDANFDAELIAVVAEYCAQNKTSPAAINPLEFNLSEEEISQHYHLRTALSRHDDNNGGEGTSAAAAAAAAGGSEVAVAETILDALQQRLVLLQAMNKAIQEARLLSLADLTQLQTEGSLANSIFKIRGIVLPDVKDGIWKSVIKKTNSTLSYPYINVARLDALDQRDKAPSDETIEHSLFGQVCKEMKKYSAKELRQSSRAWHVDFKNERATDAGGPYRESFTFLIEELQLPFMPLLIPTPNEPNVFIPNPSLTGAHHMEYYNFLGRLMGIALRVKMTLDIKLAPIFWKQILRQPLERDDLRSLDAMLLQVNDALVDIDKQGVTPEAFGDVIFEKFTTRGLDGTEVEVCEGGARRDVTFENRQEYVTLVEEYRLNETAAQCQAIREGIGAIIPLSFMDLFTWRELQLRVCGKDDIDLVLLKKKTYVSGHSSDSQVIKWFWEVLEECTAEQRCKYLRYVWGRSRLPLTEADFEQQHCLSELYGGTDQSFPVAHTCSFQLDLPRYSSKDVLRSKLLFAITNVASIDGD